MPGEILKERRKTKENQIRIEKQLFDNTVNDAYQKGDLSLGAVTVGVKCLQYYLESKYAVRLGRAGLVQLSRISDNIPEPDFELKTSEQLNAMGKIARQRYKSRIDDFIEKKTGRWFKDNRKTVELNLEGLSQEAHDLRKKAKALVKDNEDVKLKRNAIDHSETLLERDEHAESYVEYTVSEVAKHVNPEEYKKYYSYAVDRVDAMRIVLALGSAGNEELLRQVEEHEMKLQNICSKMMALNSSEALIKELSSDDMSVKNAVDDLKVKLIAMDKIVELEGEVLEERVAAFFEGRAPEEVTEGNHRGVRLKKYVSAAFLSDYRYKVAEVLKKHKWAEGTLNGEKGEFEVEIKNQLAKEFIQQKKKRARDISIKHQAVKDAVINDENESFASLKMTVTIDDAIKYKSVSNGFITYEPLEENPGLYVLKASLPTEDTLTMDNKPFGIVKINPRRCHNIFMKHMVTRLDFIANEKNDKKRWNLENQLSEYKYAETVEEYAAVFHLDVNKLSSEDVEDIKSVICYIKQYRPLDRDIFEGMTNYIDRCNTFDAEAENLRDKLKNMVLSAGRTKTGLRVEDVQACEYLLRKYMRDAESKQAFETLLDKCMAKLVLTRELEYKKFMEIKSLDPDSEVVPVLDECRSNAMFVTAVARNRESYLSPDELSKKYARMQFMYSVWDKKDEYLEYMKERYNDFYNKLKKLDKDSPEYKQRFELYMTYISTYEYHYIPKLGETENEVITVEGFAAETKDAFKSPVTMNPAIGIYRKKPGEERGRMIDRNRQAFEPIETVTEYYKQDKGVITDDLNLLMSFAKMLIT